MPSAAYLHYQAQRERADYLTAHAGRIRTARQLNEKEVFLHAALAAHVAAWDAYLKQVVREKYNAVFGVATPAYAMMHDIAKNAMEASAKKLNTPNAENARNFMMNTSGFDPWASWANIPFGSVRLNAALAVRERINEIFKVRHSFAHGYTMPNYQWNQDAAGRTLLTCQTLRSVSGFFNSLVSKTDKDFSTYIGSSFGIARPW
jgi:hypothetical protein